MQLMGIHLFLNAIANGGEKKVVIAEDGGYLSPLVNRLALEQKTVEEVFTGYCYSNPAIDESTLKLSFMEWISKNYAGSVEHTRNGYDSLWDVEKNHGKLAFPACTLAISNFKINNESIEVAYSCINAVENILNGQGYVLNNRRGLVLGSLGSIGIPTMKLLSARLGKNNFPTH
jgi:hypothetical protein